MMAQRGKTVGEVGERQLIARIRRAVERSSSGDVARLGDDAAHLPPPPHRGQPVVSTDVLVEGTHWKSDHLSPRALGRRALVANLSDLAAMGATPHWCTLGLAMNAEVPLRWFTEMMRGLVDTAAEFSCPLVGGDLVRSPTTSLAITVAGVCATKSPPSRFDAKPGDLLCVTGDLGRAAMALDILNSGERSTRASLEKHIRPIPRLREGVLLSRGRAINALMDISDGLASDLLWICELSDVQAVVDLDALPIRSSVLKHCARHGVCEREFAAVSGEEFELLFTTSRDVDSLRATLRAEGIDTPITVIGQIAEGRGVEWRRGSKRVKAPAVPCHHFSQGRGR